MAPRNVASLALRASWRRARVTSRPDGEDADRRAVGDPDQPQRDLEPDPMPGGVAVADAAAATIGALDDLQEGLVDDGEVVGMDGEFEGETGRGAIPARRRECRGRPATPRCGVQLETRWTTRSTK